jgi:hypothetical protein
MDRIRSLLEKHPDIIRDMFALVTLALTADPAITGRDAVLDVATGPAEPG